MLLLLFSPAIHCPRFLATLLSYLVVSSHRLERRTSQSCPSWSRFFAVQMRVDLQPLLTGNHLHTPLAGFLRWPDFLVFFSSDSPSPPIHHCTTALSGPDFQQHDRASTWPLASPSSPTTRQPLNLVLLRPSFTHDHFLRYIEGITILPTQDSHGKLLLAARNMTLRALLRIII